MAHNNLSTSVSIGPGATVDLFNLTITPPTRRTCLGPLKESVCLPSLSVVDSSTACVLPRNPDEDDVTDRINVRIYKNGAEYGWTDYKSDYQIDNPTYGRGARCQASIPLSVDVASSIVVKAKNTFTSSRTVSAYLSQVGSPWFLAGKEYEPIELDLPPGSTIYLKMEPFTMDPVKWMSLGCSRAVALGADYYYEVEGTGILTFTFTFQEIPFEGLLVKGKGWGGCISMIAADVRG